MRAIGIIEENNKVYNIFKAVPEECGIRDYALFSGEFSLGGSALQALSGDILTVRAAPSLSAVFSAGYVDILIIGKVTQQQNFEGFPSPKAIIITLDDIPKLINIPAGIQIISCGLKEKDSVTITSMNNACPLLSLQREIMDIKGNVIAANEFKLRFKETGDSDAQYGLMAAYTSLLLSGFLIGKD